MGCSPCKEIPKMLVSGANYCFIVSRPPKSPIVK